MRPPIPKPSVDIVVSAVRQKGTLERAAKHLGVKRSTIENWLRNDAELRAAVREARALLPYHGAHPHQTRAPKEARKMPKRVRDATPLANRVVTNHELRKAGFWKP